MIITNINMDTYRILSTTKHTVTISPIKRINNTAIISDESDTIPRNKVKNYIHYTPRNIIHLSTIDDITPEMLDFIYNNNRVKHWQHTNGIHEVIIYTQSLSEAIRYYKYQLKSLLSSYDGQCNYHILYKNVWYMPYKTYRSGCYGN